MITLKSAVTIMKLACAFIATIFLTYFIIFLVSFGPLISYTTQMILVGLASYHNFREWYENPNWNNIPIHPDSKAALDAMIERHPYFKDRKNFSEQYRQTQWYIVLKDSQANGDFPEDSQRSIAHRIGINDGTLSLWLRDIKQPGLINRLLIHEKARCYHEAKFPREFRGYRVDPSTIYNAIRPLQHQPHTPENLTNALEHHYKSTDPTHFLVIEFKTYHESGPRWTRNVGKAIETHRTQIEHLLNQRNLPTDYPLTTLRLATHDHALYIWHHRHTPDAWLTLLKHEYFYFDTTNVKNLLINKACAHLNTSHFELGKIIPQLTDHPTELQNQKSPLADLSRRKLYIIGETLYFLLDASARDFEDIQLFITRLGRDTQGDGRGGIHNPIFLGFEALDEFRARAVAIALSDGHIHHENKQFTYIEKDPDRQEYVKQLFRNNLGDIHFGEDSKTDKINMPVVIGRLLEQWGVPAGDKHLSQNFRLLATITNGTQKIKCIYLSEVIPEDGSFVLSSNKTKFTIKRATILDAGNKAKEYNFIPKITVQQKTFLKQYGKQQTLTIGDDQPRKQIILSWGELKTLVKSPEHGIRTQAKELMQVIEQNRCRLLDDEVRLIKSLGIEMNTYKRRIRLHTSGRVSLTWEAETKTTDAAIRWALLAPPASGRKRQAVEDWLQTQGEKVDRIRLKLKSTQEES